MVPKRMKQTSPNEAWISLPRIVLLACTQNKWCCWTTGAETSAWIRILIVESLASRTRKESREAVLGTLAVYPTVDRHGVQDSVLVAVIVRQLPESLRHHIELNLDEFATYDDVRQLVAQQSEIRAEYKPSVYGTAASSNTAAANPVDDPMVIGALPWQDKGKGKGNKGSQSDWSKGWSSDWSKGKGKGKGAKGKDKGNSKGKGTKGKDKGKDSSGGKGQQGASTGTKVNAVTGEEQPSAENATGEQEGQVAAILTVPSGYVCALRVAPQCCASDQRSIFIDSCVDEHVVPRGWVPAEVKNTCPKGPSRMRLFDVQGQPLQTTEAMIVTLELGTGAQVVRTQQKVVEGDVTLAVLSAGLLSDSGVTSSFTQVPELV
eukprot:2117088-Amphidinium_carterae.1